MSTVKVDFTPAEPVTVPESGVAGDDIAMKRKELFAKFEASEAVATSGGGIDLAKMALEKTAPVEQVDSVVVQTPVGEIVFGPPAGISLTLRIANIMGEDNPNRVQSAMLRTLMSVRSIDGKPVSPINSQIEAQLLANMLGDRVLDYLYSTLNEIWPPPGKGELQVLRKNKRVA